MGQYRKYTAVLFKRVTSLSNLQDLFHPRGSWGKKFVLQLKYRAKSPISQKSILTPCQLYDILLSVHACLNCRKSSSDAEASIYQCQH